MQEQRQNNTKKEEEGSQADTTMAAALSKLKLRPTKTEDRSAPLLKGEVDQVDIDSYQNAVLDINIESWLNLIPNETFPTEFYPITIEDAKIFIKAYEQLQVEKRSELSDDVRLEMEKIANGLQVVIDRVRSNGPNAPPDEHVFVKTSCRSAKDATVYDSKFRSLYHQHLHSSLNNRNPHSENDQIRSLLDAAIDVLKVQSALKLLQDVFSTSERVYQDMTLAMSHPDRFQQHFIIRKWIDIDSGMEFRGFVHGDKLNALSQYNHLVLYPELVQNKDAILGTILQFFEKVVKSKLEKGNFKDGYVIDFAVTGPATPSSKFNVWVIELNPFLYSTDGCLFSWKDERNLLEKGPFEFRIRTRELVGAKSQLAMDWRDVVESESKLLLKSRHTET